MNLLLATFNGYKGLLIFSQKHVFSAPCWSKFQTVTSLTGVTCAVST